ncbi:Glycosyltransferase involved in cell wall bisynthesis [Filimonas lacunae]|uniref:Glycosyltransferase involved in cell wall bisynthesis n=1 Tax=Filimonas lacunae TaxID=477680 RepID=A0A173MNS3_9BACT|nr:glycosyltransferase [Filimonas lacunae]BAV09127.1 glycosyl transferase, group 1 family protein [Filimonas lacunae]SIS67636.1 Glycosyltransferase involved in cell wall bisynthesis [Filimonas lacunae]
MSETVTKKVIAHVTFSFTNGGTENVIVDLVNFQVNIFPVVMLVIINNAVDEDLLKQVDARVVVIRLKRSPGSRSPMHVIRLNRILLTYNPDVIHAHHEKVISLIYGASGKKILTVHATGYEVGNMHKYSKVIGISPAVEYDVKARSTNLLNAAIMPNGVDTGKVRSRWLGNFKSPLKMVQIGRLVHSVKGQHILLSALHQLLTVHKVHDFEMHFVGEGPSREFLEQLCHSLGLQKQVSFLGLKDRDWIYDNLCEYGLLIQPSLEEGFGLAIAEAMAANVLSVVADLPAPMMLIENGRLGYYFEKGNAGSCAATIMEVINSSQDQRQKMREAAREHVLTHYSLQTMNEAYVSLYNAS